MRGSVAGFGLAAAMLVAPSLRAQVVDPFPDEASPLLDNPQVEKIYLTVAPENWQTLQERFLEDDYYPATLHWRDVVVENVGIRSRGNGSRNAIKPSLKVSIDKFQKQKFLGLETVVLLNLVQDPPMLREYLSMQAFRKLGAPAPRQSFVQLYVNDEYLGLYLATEAIDKDFLKHAVGDDEGWLYDYEWAYPYHWEYLGPDPILYCDVPFQAETKKNSRNVEALIEMIQKLDATDGDRFAGDMEGVLNLDSFLRHLAMEIYLAETDGMVGDVGTNNFYLYQGEEDRRFTFIAWDKSSTFAYAGYPIWRNIADNRLTQKALANPMLRERFLTHLRVIADELGGEGGWLDMTAHDAMSRIWEAGHLDNKRPYSDAEFDQSMLDTLRFIRERHLEVTRQIEEESSTSEEARHKELVLLLGVDPG